MNLAMTTEYVLTFSVGDFLLLTEGNSGVLSVRGSVCLRKAIVTLGAGTVLVGIQ